MEEMEIHGLNFRSGMIASWNKFCFTTGYIEVSISLPGSADAAGFWPGKSTPSSTCVIPTYQVDLQLPGHWATWYDLSCDASWYTNSFRSFRGALASVLRQKEPGLTATTAVT